MRPLFVYEERPPPKADALYDMFPATFSAPGSNIREKEEATMMIWNDFLQMVQGNCVVGLIGMGYWWSYILLAITNKCL